MMTLKRRLMIVIRLPAQMNHSKIIDSDPLLNSIDSMTQIDQIYLMSFIELQTLIHHKEINHGTIERNQSASYFHHC